MICPNTKTARSGRAEGYADLGRVYAQAFIKAGEVHALTSIRVFCCTPSGWNEGAVYIFLLLLLLKRLYMRRCLLSLLNVSDVVRWTAYLQPSP